MTWNFQIRDLIIFTGMVCLSTAFAMTFPGMLIAPQARLLALIAVLGVTLVLTWSLRDIRRTRILAWAVIPLSIAATATAFVLWTPVKIEIGSLIESAEAAIWRHGGHKLALSVISDNPDSYSETFRSRRGRTTTGEKKVSGTVLAKWAIL